MSEQRQTLHADSGRSLDRVRQERALQRASRQESWLEQLQRIADQTRGAPRPHE
jgi:hypothetical protein